MARSPSPCRGSAAAAPAAAAHARSGAPLLLPSSALGGGGGSIGSAGMDWHDYDLLRASGAATVHGYYGGGTAGGYHDEVGRKMVRLIQNYKYKWIGGAHCLF